MYLYIYCVYIHICVLQMITIHWPSRTLSWDSYPLLIIIPVTSHYLNTPYMFFFCIMLYRTYIIKL